MMQMQKKKKKIEQVKMEFNNKPKVVHPAQGVLKVKHLTIYNVTIRALPESTRKTKK
jgi:hypothetical protein